ncbi:MAG: qaraquat-inducible protein B, partial [Halothiobacillaceae bacterium]
MSEAPEPLPTAVVVERSGFSLIWIIPLVAAAIAGWLVYQSITSRGPTVTIVMSSAEGIEADKTKIKHKDVELGIVKRVELNQELSQVMVTAELVKGSERYLTDKTRFWVVRARVAAGEISGLGTLFSGAYIGIDPVTEGTPTFTFKSLEKPPLVTADEEGRHYTLRAGSLGSTDIGAPVYYRQIEVGQVVNYALAPNGEYIDIDVFIRAPHYNKVSRGTRFWNASGLDVSINANGLNINTESLVTLLLGGIAFETPVSLEKLDPAEERTTFQLYESHTAAQTKRYAKKDYYLLYFDESVRGLTADSPVEFRGIQIGRVVDVRIQYDPDKVEVRIPVLVEIEPERFNIETKQRSGAAARVEHTATVQALVAKGLRAQLKTGNLVTGQLVVSLDFYPKAAPEQIDASGRYPILPTIPTQLAEITTAVAEVIEKINHLPLEEIGSDLKKTAQGVSQLVNSPDLKESIKLLGEALRNIKELSQNLNTEVTPSIKQTLNSVDETL